MNKAQARVFLVGVFIFLLVTSGSAGKGSKAMELSVSLKGDVVSLQLYNSTNEPQEFYDSLKLQNAEFPYFVWIKMRKKGGNVINDWPTQSKDGRFTPLFFYSENIRLPTKLQTLKAGEKVRKNVPLKSFFVGTKYDSNDSDIELKVFCNIYLDSNLDTFISSETNWVSLPKSR